MNLCSRYDWDFNPVTCIHSNMICMRMLHSHDHDCCHNYKKGGNIEICSTLVSQTQLALTGLFLRIRTGRHVTILVRSNGRSTMFAHLFGI